VRSFGRNGRGATPSQHLVAATSEQIEAYMKLCAEARSTKEASVKSAKSKDPKKKPPKTPKKPKVFFTTENESVVALARAVGDKQVKKAGTIVETKRRY
jgi:hypothetical protein